MRHVRSNKNPHARQPLKSVRSMHQIEPMRQPDPTPQRMVEVEQEPEMVPVATFAAASTAAAPEPAQAQAQAAAAAPREQPQLRATMDSTNGDGLASSGEEVTLRIEASRRLKAPPRVAFPKNSAPVAATGVGTSGLRYEVTYKVADDSPAGPVEFWVEPSAADVAPGDTPKRTSGIANRSGVPVRIVHQPPLLLTMVSNSAGARAGAGDKLRLVIKTATGERLTSPPTASLMGQPEKKARTSDGGMTWEIAQPVNSDDAEGPASCLARTHEYNRHSDPTTTLAGGAAPVVVYLVPQLAVSMRSSTGDTHATEGDTVYLEMIASKPLTDAPSGFVGAGTEEVPAVPSSDDGQSWFIAKAVHEGDMPAGSVAFAVHINEPGTAHKPVSHLHAGQHAVEVYYELPPPKFTITMTGTNGNRPTLRAGDRVTLEVIANRALTSAPTAALVDDTEAPLKARGAEATHWYLTRNISSEDAEGDVAFHVRHTEGGTPGRPTSQLATGAKPLRIEHPLTLRAVAMGTTAADSRARVGDTVWVDFESNRPLASPPTGYLVYGTPERDMEPLDDAGLRWRLSHKVAASDEEGPIEFQAATNEGGARGPLVEDLDAGSAGSAAAAITLYHAAVLRCVMGSSTGDNRATTGDTVWLDITSSKILTRPPEVVLGEGQKPTAADAEDQEGHTWRVTRDVTAADVAGPVAFTVVAFDPQQPEVEETRCTTLVHDDEPVEIYFAEPLPQLEVVMHSSAAAGRAATVGDKVWLEITADRPLKAPPTGCLGSDGSGPLSTPVQAAQEDAEGRVWRLEHVVTRDDLVANVPFYVQPTLAGVAGTPVSQVKAGTKPVTVAFEPKVFVAMGASAGSGQVTTGDKVWLDITSDRALSKAPMVFLVVKDTPADVQPYGSGNGTEWRAERTIQAGDPEGPCWFVVKHCEPALDGGDAEAVSELTNSEPRAVVYFVPQVTISMGCSNGTQTAHVGDTVWLEVESTHPLQQPPNAALGEEAAKPMELVPGSGGCRYRIERVVHVHDKEGAMAFEVKPRGAAHIAKTVPDDKVVHVAAPAALACTMTSSSGTTAATVGEVVWLDVRSSEPLDGVRGALVRGKPVMQAEKRSDDGRQWRLQHKVVAADAEGAVVWWVQAMTAGEEGDKVSALAAGTRPVRIFHLPELLTRMGSSNGSASASAGDTVFVDIVSNKPLSSPPTGALFGAAEVAAKPVGSDRKHWRLTSNAVAPETATGPVPFWVRTHEHGVDGPVVSTLSNGQAAVVVKEAVRSCACVVLCVCTAATHLTVWPPPDLPK